MFINHKDIICFISKISHPYRIWYHIWIDTRYGDDYIREKFGVTDSLIQQKLQNEFQEALLSYRENPTDVLDPYVLRLDKTDYPFYLSAKTRDSVTVYMEKGLFTLYPDQPGGIERPPLGYPWAPIYRSDKPEIIQAKLYDHRKRFGVAMQKKLRKICGW
jgi:hypothetical protein